MKTLDYFKRNWIPILAVVDGLLMVLLIALFVTSPTIYGQALITKANIFGGVMSVISALILFAAFYQSKKANNRENSLVFYQEELRNIEVLEENSIKDRTNEATKHYHNLFKIRSDNLTYKNASFYFNQLFHALNVLDFKELLDTYKEEGKKGLHNTTLLNLYNMVNYVLYYIKHIGYITFEVRNIQKLEMKNYIIPSHAELLYRRLYNLVSDYFMLIDRINDTDLQFKDILVPVASLTVSTEYAQPSYDFLFKTQVLLNGYEELKFLKEYEVFEIKQI